MDQLLRLLASAVSVLVAQDDIVPINVGERILGALARRPPVLVAGPRMDHMAPALGHPAYYRAMVPY
jgi:hypothetical protein